ncbi:hypothetical protein EN780_06410 [Mesorhizobium sp. M4B.F.Ca.ET.089.01.1.1]|uniref:SMEK domain-containing protein n=1 Tax=Mesorhizobium sp. M4B.F.Ca.ET.089.01.1.1 TaxID=2496662 RepID=UPI000FE3AA60|nr:SMEK domain-containing protein [Mesorhizobium sp. M4B.F.Ca.ET.089.01.1.1]RWX69386.1 hypothetical protein EN780_06410 [Mesorhizobium sp. M4B.F.Ca.ET.089.01.1.1]
MNRDEYLNSCGKYLGRLVYEIKALNAVGRFDINSVTEDFLVPVLRVTFDCPELQNQNELKQNFPSVDLGCRRSRTSFQITTDASTDKVVKTLEKFREHNLEKIFDRLIVLTISEKQSAYTAKSLHKAISELTISFDPAQDILGVTDILLRIKRLETSKLERVEAYLVSEFRKRDEHLKFREQFEKFLEFAQSKIAVEKSSKKYIPSLFVETHKTKKEMRLFANPLFFYRKVIDLLKKFEYTHLNSVLALAKEPKITFAVNADALTAIPSTFAELEGWLKGLDEAVVAELQKVGPLSWNHKEYDEKYEPAHGDSAAWSIARFRVESTATGLSSQLKRARSLIHLMQKKIFLVTSMAGQGKTNFVCDLIENQFRSFEIPCVFIPARELNSYPARQRLRGFISNNRYAPNYTSMHEYLGLFDDVAKEGGKPFLIVIDGINEVTALDEFNDELKDFCNAVCQYEHVKVVITCRSEFFDEKYASILYEPFSKHVHRVTDLRSKMSELSKKRLLHSYLTHFNVAGRLAGSAKEFLKNDLLLLRIFCERHEGDDVGDLSDVYKGDLFEEFLLRKIDSFPENLRGKAFPTLLKIASAMLAADDYSKLSVRGFLDDEKEIVHRLVADDVILRQEIAAKSLMGLGDLVISFTYDELRDFIIAYKLVDEVAGDNAEILLEVLSSLPGRPIFEGVYKYVYLLSRKANKIAAIAACERADGFIDHFALNVHLLPPAVQNADDVAKLKKILTETSVPGRVKRAALFLIGRRNRAELLNITVLIAHLNGLGPDGHKEFVQAIFYEPNDFGSENWQERIDVLVESVWDVSSEDGLKRYAPEWLAFFLHVSSFASWFERERVSLLFKNSKEETNCRQALQLVRSAKSRSIQYLLADIEEPQEAM